MRGECPDWVVEVSVGAQLATNVPEQGEIGASPPAVPDPPVVDPPAVLPSSTVEVVPLPALSEEHIHVSDPSVPELEGESVVSVPVEMVTVEGIQHASIVGGKRSQSPTQQKSSPRCKKDRRRDKSPWGECSVSASDPDESDGSVSEDLSFDSDLPLGVEPENVPLPVDDDTELDLDTMNSPLTQITPNLPGVLPGRPPIPVPEDLQASEETRVVTRFFATLGSNSQNQRDSMELAYAFSNI
jgi:hypothetical protein